MGTWLFTFSWGRSIGPLTDATLSESQSRIDIQVGGPSAGGFSPARVRRPERHARTISSRIAPLEILHLDGKCPTRRLHRRRVSRTRIAGATGRAAGRQKRRRSIRLTVVTNLRCWMLNPSIHRLSPGLGTYRFGLCFGFCAVRTGLSHSFSCRKASPARACSVPSRRASTRTAARGICQCRPAHATV